MAIHDQNYVRYDGPLHEGRAGWTIAWTSFRTYLSFLRTKLVLLLLWLSVPVPAAVLVLIEYAVRGQVGQFTEVGAPSGSFVSFFLQAQVFSLAILLMAAGCGVISEDIRYRTFQLYFSKPVSRLEYGLGKFGSLVLLGSLITVVPATVVGALRAAFFTQTTFFGDVIAQTGTAIGLSLMVTLVLCAIVAGLSSLTRRTGYVVLAWIGVLLVPLILRGIVAIATDGSDAAKLWDITGNFLVLSEWLLVADFAFDGPHWLAPIVLVALAAAGLGAMAWRISKLEGIA